MLLNGFPKLNAYARLVSGFHAHLHRVAANLSCDACQAPRPLLATVGGGRERRIVRAAPEPGSDGTPVHPGYLESEAVQEQDGGAGHSIRDGIDDRASNSRRLLLGPGNGRQQQTEGEHHNRSYGEQRASVMGEGGVPAVFRTWSLTLAFLPYRVSRLPKTHRATLQ